MKFKSELCYDLNNSILDDLCCELTNKLEQLSSMLGNLDEFVASHPWLASCHAVHTRAPNTNDATEQDTARLALLCDQMVGAYLATMSVEVPKRLKIDPQDSGA